MTRGVSIKILVFTNCFQNEIQKRVAKVHTNEYNKNKQKLRVAARKSCTLAREGKD